MGKAVLIKQTKAATQSDPKQRATLKALGVRGVGSRILRKDTTAVRGMLNKVQHLICAERVDESKTIPSTKIGRGKGYRLG